MSVKTLHTTLSFAPASQPFSVLLMPRSLHEFARWQHRAIVWYLSLDQSLMCDRLVEYYALSLWYFSSICLRLIHYALCFLWLISVSLFLNPVNTDDPTNSVIALKDDSFPGQGPSLLDWPLTWKTIILQCYYTVGWVIWPVKSSPKWRIMCRVGC